ncbi:MAG TPA: right-handed parallel beta-helix repeat-containing protein [Verrucomicrobiae bacterium]|nr:right-handed parallel beta-helix repeat-containing protein [Verrucomicrobiae bacterium]
MKFMIYDLRLMKRARLGTTCFRFLLLLLSLNVQLSMSFAQGSLTPPGAPVPTMRSLGQVEPRTPIASLPFVITNSGSYYLTENLAGSSKFTNGITISVADVTLDLMGFALVGGAGDGIVVRGTCTNVAVRNGTVRGWSGNGVDLFEGRAGQLERLRVSGNGGRGIYAGLGSVVNHCTAYANNGNGISVTIGVTVNGCSAYSNGGDGIVTSSGCTVTDSTARLNGGHGISTSTACTISRCTAYNNSGTGIFGTVGSTVIDCTVSFNGLAGIQVTNSCRIVQNNCYNNSGAGIHATGGDNRIEGNNITGNHLGIDADGIGNLIIRNSASGNTTNFVIVAGNKVGPIAAAPDSAAISGDTGGSGVGSTNPWANVSY